MPTASPDDLLPKVHAWAVEEREYRRHEGRRGRRHAYERLDPARTALVVVDMVPFFVEGSAPRDRALVRPAAEVVDLIRG